MPGGPTAPGPNIKHAEMECRGARSQSLQEQELEEAFVDSRMPGAQRFRINLIGMGVVE